MAWEDRYQQGKLGGVEFYLKRHSHQGKHRVAVYKYPESNRIDYVKQGRDEFTFSLSAYVIGGGKNAIDYDIARNRLWDILRSGGTTTLVHPYLGTTKVHIRSFSMSENDKEGNIAKFRMSLSQVSETVRQQVTDVSSVANIDLLLKWIRDIDLSEIANLQEMNLSTNWRPQTRISLAQKLLIGVFKITGILSEKMDFVREKLDKALVAVQLAQTAVHTTVKFKRKLSQIRTQADRLLLDSAELYNQITELLTIGHNPYGLDGSSVTRFWSMVKLSTTNIVDNNIWVQNWREKTPEEETAEIKKNQLIAQVYGETEDATNPIIILRMVALLQMIRSAMAIRFRDLSELADVESQSLQIINNDLQRNDITTERRRVLHNIKAEMIKHFAQARGYLGSEDIVVPPFDTNAILATYQQTGDLAGLDNLTQMNTVENPMFITAGEPIKARRL